jgi:transposase
MSRDRGGTSAEASREGAPGAIQVADRFHLSQNFGETLERIMRREYPRDLRCGNPASRSIAAIAAA